MTNSNLFSRIKKPLFYLSFVLVLSCAGGPDDSYMGFFQPETSINSDSFYPYHFSLSFLYGADDFDVFQTDSVNYREDDNLRSWLDYIGGNYTIQEAGQAIYRSNNTSTRPDNDTNNRISKVFLQAIQKRPAAMKYLEFAWDVESMQRQSGSWSDEPTKADDSIEFQLPIALKMARSQKDQFLKERYAFQAIKINAELHNLDDEIKLYDEYFSHSKTRSAISYWAESRVGGAYLIKGDTAQAIYHFGQVFQNCASRRYAAYMSLRLNDVMFLPQALTYCKNGKEKAAVYALCAVQPWQESTGILTGMMAADPSDSLIRLVFVRELNKAEYDRSYSPQYAYNPEYNYIDSGRLARAKSSSSTLQKLREFSAVAAGSDKVPRHDFWLTAEAHTAFLLGDFTGSDKLLAEAEQMGSKDSLLQDQMLLQRFLLFSELTKEMTPAKEEELLPMLLRFSDGWGMQHSNAFKYAAHNIQQLYSRQSPHIIKGNIFACNSASESSSSSLVEYSEAKAFLFGLLAKGHYSPVISSEPRYPERKGYADLDLLGNEAPSATVQATLNYFQGKDLRDYDKKLQIISRVSTAPLYRLLGTRALIEHKYDVATEAFSHIDTSIWSNEPYPIYLAANPFSTGIHDTHAQVPADTLKYNPFTYAKKMSELSEKAKHGGSAEDCFELACGAYNMTAWGNSWLMIQSGWTGPDELVDEYWYSSSGESVDSNYYFLIQEAEHYFNEAAARATDREFKARSVFMAAKCEQKRFYYYLRGRHNEITKTRDVQWRDESTIDSLLYLDQKKSYRQYFNKLLSDYADTKFSDEAKTECAFYDRYAKGK
ncbi:MAG: hypothetical protein Q8916_05630 [Bacteroidota bacterium]|nr:hypothetical protein [Bacteroidota bacterium]MDP4229871.1 hypothetical protein [Bacteroidota bacterium]MDP4235992.1 hypothetical protein [Bacteroidota bacterium]